jgi:hypothetical protein
VRLELNLTLGMDADSTLLLPRCHSNYRDTEGVGHHRRTDLHYQ